MTSLEIAVQAKRSAASAWMQYVQEHVAKSRDWFLFVEGDNDSLVYGQRVHGLLGEEKLVHTYLCGRKRDVHEVRNKFATEGRTCVHSLFFTDADHDALLGIPAPAMDDLFQTQHYSVEYYYLTDALLSAIWQYCWRLQPQDARLAKYEAQLRNRSQVFFRRMLIVVAWLICARRAGFRPMYNNLNPMSLFSRFGDSIETLAHRMSVIRAHVNCEFQCSIRDLLVETRKLRQMSYKSWLPGQYYQSFILDALRSIVSDLRAGPEPHPTLAIPLSVDALGSLLVGRVGPLADLDGFLARINCRPGTSHC